MSSQISLIIAITFISVCVPNCRHFISLIRCMLLLFQQLRKLTLLLLNLLLVLNLIRLNFFQFVVSTFNEMFKVLAFLSHDARAWNLFHLAFELYIMLSFLLLSTFVSKFTLLLVDGNLELALKRLIVGHDLAALSDLFRLLCRHRIW